MSDLNDDQFLINDEDDDGDSIISEGKEAKLLEEEDSEGEILELKAEESFEDKRNEEKRKEKFSKERNISTESNSTERISVSKKYSKNQQNDKIIKLPKNNVKKEGLQQTNNNWGNGNMRNQTSGRSNQTQLRSNNAGGVGRAIKRSKTVLINPRFQGTVHVTTTPRSWDTTEIGSYQGPKNQQQYAQRWIPGNAPINQLPLGPPQVPLVQPQVSLQNYNVPQQYVHQNPHPVAYQQQQLSNVYQEPPQQPPPQVQINSWNDQYQPPNSTQSQHPQFQVPVTNKPVSVHQRLGFPDRHIYSSQPNMQPNQYNNLTYQNPQIPTFTEPPPNFINQNNQLYNAHHNQPYYDQQPGMEQNYHMYAPQQNMLNQPIAPHQMHPIQPVNHQMVNQMYNQQIMQNSMPFNPEYIPRYGPPPSKMEPQRIVRETFNQVPFKKRFPGNKRPFPKDIPLRKRNIVEPVKTETESFHAAPVPEDEDEETREYRLKIEEQKRQREEIFRKKEERRLLLLNNKLGYTSPNIVITGNEHERFVKPKPANYNVAIKNTTADADIDPKSIASFLTNRKVLAKDESLASTNIVIVKNLASATTDSQLLKMCRGIGDVQKLQMEKQERQATIHFKSVASAHAFFKKFRRYMIDLSIIEVVLSPIENK